MVLYYTWVMQNFVHQQYYYPKWARVLLTYFTMSPSCMQKSCRYPHTALLAWPCPCAFLHHVKLALHLKCLRQINCEKLRHIPFRD